jgi:protein-S-isoprenylcysteine O-methyltransferase Ste14
MGVCFKYYRLIYSVIAVITLAAILLWQFSIPAYPLFVSNWIKQIIGVPLGLLGLVLMAVCIRKYFFKLSGVAALYHRQGPPTLETSGIHRFVRHPLYAGTILVIWSLLLFFPSLANLIVCVLITSYVRIGIQSEENKLLRQFGEQYRNYLNSTPMLFPTLSSQGIRRRG